jgi:type III pantothenate kinase
MAGLVHGGASWELIVEGFSFELNPELTPRALILKSSKPKPKPFLLIDVSNSYTKLALASRTKIFRVVKIPTPKLSPKTLRAAVGAADFEVAVISSVVPDSSKALRLFLKGKRVLKVGPKLNLGVGIDYPEPSSIGADRLANAAAVAALIGTPAVVVDFGTAVTFDIISPGKKYIGGVIAPGLEVMTDYLYQRTALLPRIDLQEPVSAVGKSTRSAMMAGAIFGYRGLVKQILAEIHQEIGAKSRLKVIATGGYAQLIASKLPEIGKVYPNLTLEGLRIIGVLNP